MNLYNNLKRTVRSCNLKLAAYNESPCQRKMTRAAPARGLAELFLITYFGLLYSQILH